ncbi:MAG: SpoIID/LytB domain-containing protein, partial [Clostridia bacterium]|nr:SpoIID/LytB domain-containing protein [Clostridia bacterium]
MGSTKNTKKSIAAKKAKEAEARRLKRRNRLIGVTCGILCTVIAVIAVVLFFPRNNRTDINAQPSDIVDKGLVRVFLRSLDNPVAMGLTLDGIYTVDGDAGFRFDKGTEITVAQDSGSLYLKAGGLTIDMGSSFNLIRHAPEKEGEDAGGLYIHSSEKDNLFAGDLRLTASGKGIDSILTIQAEDYLYGVVAYEMSNSWPLESLKAQAIAARTYVMRAREANKSKSYDVVDTTADQVFKGFDKSLSNVIQAVDETRGIVGMTNGQFAQCYYTASNGGQIATTKQIWGGTVSYIEMKDDPYDLENPLSRENMALIPAQPEHGSALETALGRAAKELIPDAAELRVDSIESVRLADPDTSGSLMYANVQFEITLSKQIRQLQTPSPSTLSRPRIVYAHRDSQGKLVQIERDPNAPVYVLSDWTKCDGKYTVKLSTYNQLKSMLKLAINSSAYEVFYLEKAK